VQLYHFIFGERRHCKVAVFSLSRDRQMLPDRIAFADWNAPFTYNVMLIIGTP
jgi:hypothetical protein